jgi:hypothetical protein
VYLWGDCHFIFLSLQFAQVVAQPVVSLVQGLLVLLHPVKERTQILVIESVQALTPYRAALNQTHIAQYSQVL